MVGKPNGCYETSVGGIRQVESWIRAVEGIQSLSNVGQAHPIILSGPFCVGLVNSRPIVTTVQNELIALPIAPRTQIALPWLLA